MSGDHHRTGWPWVWMKWKSHQNWLLSRTNIFGSQRPFGRDAIRLHQPRWKTGKSLENLPFTFRRKLVNGVGSCSHQSMKFKCYPICQPEPNVQPASADRGWMDETDERHAYRCLPLSIANAAGWEILNPVAFSAIWNGFQNLLRSRPVYAVKWSRERSGVSPLFSRQKSVRVLRRNVCVSKRGRKMQNTREESAELLLMFRCDICAYLYVCTVQGKTIRRKQTINFWEIHNVVQVQKGPIGSFKSPNRTETIEVFAIFDNVVRMRKIQGIFPTIVTVTKRCLASGKTSLLARPIFLTLSMLTWMLCT